MRRCHGLFVRCSCQMETGPLIYGWMQPDAWSLSQCPTQSGYRAGMSCLAWWMPTPIPLWGGQQGCRWLWISPRH
jgi:hypothetical protein